MAIGKLIMMYTEPGVAMLKYNARRRKKDVLWLRDLSSASPYDQGHSSGAV